MTEDVIPSDVAIMDMLRKRESMSVAELSASMEVTATAIRQRLTRLMAQGYIDRIPVRAGRGRPSHRYVLTVKGRRKTGANFADLAIALWQEIREIKDVEIRQGLLRRIARRLAATYSGQIDGATLERRMESLSELYAERRIPFSVDRTGDLPVLTALACPYPDLAEQDRAVCAMERMLFTEILGEEMRLDECRLDDGSSCCRFEPAKPTAKPSSSES